MQRVALFAIALMMVFVIGIYQQAIALAPVNETGNMTNETDTISNDSSNFTSGAKPPISGKTLD